MPEKTGSPLPDLTSLPLLAALSENMREDENIKHQ